MKSYAKASHGNSGSRNIFGNSILIGNWLVSGYYTYFIKKTHRKLTCTRTTGDWSFVNMYFWRCQCPSFNLWEDNQMNVDSGLHSHHSTHIFIFIFIAEHNFYYCVCQSACKASFVSNLFFFFFYPGILNLLLQRIFQSSWASVILWFPKAPFWVLL